ncbi:PLC-like phosphodiesterase [Kalaharituber pfeilii]|nr:PLC-like phosphodiesterase [Kalaharituber pfeilii]
MLYSPRQLLSTFLLLGSPLLTLAKYNPKACNNSPHLCSVSYGAITHLGTHNSPFLRDHSTGFSASGNQYFNVSVQLDAGVRLLQGQLHRANNGGEPRMCHSSCSLMDGGTLGDWLTEVKIWLDNHPSDVVTLLIANQDRIPASDLLPSFSKSDTAPLAYVPSPAGIKIPKFPTLQTLIDENKRLVVFVTSGEDDKIAPFLLYEWDYIWETKWENKDEGGMSCEVDRPGRLKGPGGISRAEAQGVVPLLNWFLYYEISGLGVLRPYVEKIQNTNGPLLQSGLEKCKNEWSRAPTFILVDFFNEGNPILHVDLINNVTKPVNRVNPPSTPSEDDPPSGSIKGKTQGEERLDRLLLEIDEHGKVTTWGDWILASGDWGDGFDIDALKQD